MTKPKPKKKYPILALRVKANEMAYIRREADERNMTIAKYVKTILIPFALPEDYRR